MKRFVFVCDYGQARSPCAALVARDIATERGEEWQCSVLGVKTVEQQAGEALLKDADLVVTMEPRIKNTLLERFPTTSPDIVTALNIPMSSVTTKELLVERLREELTLILVL